MRRAILTAVALSCLVTETAVAETVWDAYNGKRLQKTCESKSLFCDGYILGIVDARYDEGTFCLAGKVDTSRIVDIVKRYLQEHPDYGHVDASVLVSDALREKFPCN